MDTIYSKMTEWEKEGGVAFYLMDSLNASILAKSEDIYCRKPEIIAEITCTNASKLLLAVV